MTNSKSKKVKTRVNVSNILGASHKANWVYRMAELLIFLRVRRYPHILMLSEFQKPQQELFRQKADRYNFVAGTSDGVAWRKDTYKRKKSGSYRINYLGGHHMVPYVLLEHIKTGKKIWVFPMHLPPTMQGYDRGDRLAAAAIMKSRIETKLKEVKAPLLLGGDTNDHDWDDWLRRNLPDSEIGVYDTRRKIDWLSGIGVEWVSTDVIWNGRVQLISDHSILRATIKF